MRFSKHIFASWTFWVNAAALGGAWGASYMGMLSSESAWIATGITGLNLILRLMTDKPVHLY